MIKSISEILAEASEKATIEERVDVLHKHNSEVLQGVLKIAHTPGIKFKLPIVTGKQIGRASCRERVSSPV